MRRILTKKSIDKEFLTTKLTLIIIGLTAGSGLLIPATYASFHPVTTGEIADNTIRSADISNTAGVASVDIINGQVASVDIGTGQVASVDIGDGQVGSVDIGTGQVASVDILDGTITSQDIASGTIPSGSTPDDNSVTSAKIADGEVKSVDIGNDEVFSVDIGDGQVGSADIGTDAVTTDKISDTNGVHSVDIVDGQVGSVDIGDGQVTSGDIADNAIQPNIQIIQGSTITVNPRAFPSTNVDCPDGTFVTGGGYTLSAAELQVYSDHPVDENTWQVGALNPLPPSSGVVFTFTPYALCIGPMP